MEKTHLTPPTASPKLIRVPPASRVASVAPAGVQPRFRFRFYACLGAAVTALCLPNAYGTIVTLDATADHAAIIENTSTTINNYNRGDTLWGNNSNTGQQRNGLIQFAQLDSTVRAGLADNSINLNSVTLELWNSAALWTPPANFGLNFIPIAAANADWAALNGVDDGVNLGVCTWANKVQSVPTAWTGGVGGGYGDWGTGAGRVIFGRIIATNTSTSLGAVKYTVLFTNSATLKAWLASANPPSLLVEQSANINGTQYRFATINSVDGGGDPFAPNLVVNYGANPLVTWTNSGGGNWSVGANWDVGAAPNDSAKEAGFFGAIAASSTVTNNAVHTVNRVLFNNLTNSYTLAGASILTLAGTAPEILVSAGSHTVNTELATSGSLLKLTSTGTLVLGGSSSFADGVTISGTGNVTVNSLANGGAASSLGASASAAANLNLDGSTLKYVGTGHSTDRSFQLGGLTSSLDASGSGALVFSDTGAIGYLSSLFASTLRLTGTNAGNNTLALSLGDGVGGTSLIKDGPGKWVFGNAANSFTGNTTINQGILALSDANALVNSPVVTLASGTTLDVSAVSYTLPSNRALQGSGAVVGSFTAGAGTLTPGNPNAAGTLSFSNNLSFTGTTTVNFELAATTNGISDKIVIGGDLVLAGSTTLNISALAQPNLEVGTYTLMEYTGNLTGDASNFTVANPYAYTLVVSVDTINKKVNLNVSGTPPTLTWSGDSGFNFWQVGVTNWNSQTLPWANAAHAYFDDTGSISPYVLGSGTVAPGSVVVNNTASFPYEFRATLSGSMNLVKTGDGTLYLNYPSTYTGGNVISNGTVKMGRNNGMGITLSSNSTLCDIKVGGTLDLFGWAPKEASVPTGKILVGGNGFDGNGAIVNNRELANQGAYHLDRLVATADWSMNVVSGGQIGVRGTSTRDGYFDLNGFNFTKKGAGVMYISDVEITNSGNFIISEGPVNSWGNGAGSVGPNWAGPGSIIVSNGASFRVGLNGGGWTCSKAIQLAGTLERGQAGGVTFGGPLTLLSGYNLNFSADTWTFAGPVGGAVNFNKSTAGTIVLTGTNTYAGDTLLTSGTLIIATNGSIATSPTIDVGSGTILNVGAVTGGFKVASGQTLRGLGTVNGAITVSPGGTVSPGAGGTATLTVTNGSLTLSGNTVMEVNNAGLLSDKLLRSNAATQTQTNGGTLTIQNIGATLVVGNAFTLFSTNSVGNFAAFSPANPNSNPALNWNFNPVSGVLTVVTIPTPEPLVVTNQNNTNLVFSWTQSGWKLQTQTNTLNTGLGTNWSDYPGGITPPVNVPVSPANPSVFYRLKSQFP